MRTTIDVAPSNSLVLIMDRSIGVIPATMDGGLVSANSTCVAVGTLSEHDGETSISLSDENDVPPPGFGHSPVFDGVLDTPSMTVSVCSVLDEVLLEIQVGTAKTHVQVWANDALEPDVVAITVEPAAA
jgi:hypothetical protein